MSERVTAADFSRRTRQLTDERAAAIAACEQAAIDAAAFINTKPSEFSRDDYKRVLGDWLWWCRERYLDPYLVSGDHVSGWRDELRDGSAHLGDGTVRRYLSVLSSFYRYLQANPVPGQDARVRFNPVLWVGRPKQPPAGAQTWLSTDDALKMLMIADAAGPRALGLVSLFLLYGQPPSGIAELVCGDLARDGQDCPTIRTRGRRGYRAIVRLVNPAHDALFELARHQPPDAPLFPGRATLALGRHAAAREIADLNRAAADPLRDTAGHPRHVTPKLLTATFVTLAARAGASAQDVVELTGFEYASFTATAERSALQPTELIARYLADHASALQPAAAA